MNNLLKRIIIPPLTSLPVAKLSRQMVEPRVPIFLLHQLSEDITAGSGITEAHLRNCLSYLVKNNYRLLSLEDAILSLKHNEPLPGNAVVFTMDDGFMDQATVAAPVFLDFNCPLTFFVITDLLDQVMWPWDAKISWLINHSKKQKLVIEFPDETIRLDISDSRKKHNARFIVRDYIKETSFEKISETLAHVAHATGNDIPAKVSGTYESMNWDTARELESKGIVFAPHSKSHHILSKINPDSARNEISGSWLRLKEELNAPLNVFCYPTGRIFDYGPREIGFLKENNFLGAVSTIPGYLKDDRQTEDYMYKLPRFALPNNMTDFIQCCSWIDKIRKSG